MEAVRARVLVSGRVQGVFYRQSAAERARASGIAGSIRNLSDGRVEAVLQGERSAVEAMVAWCRVGPPHARVEHVEVTWQEAAEPVEGFRVAG